MGAWIEIINRVKAWCKPVSHPTMGAWIEITPPIDCCNLPPCRTPRWVRGLKLGVA